MATGERQSVCFPVDSGFATARQSRERASAQRENTEVDQITLHHNLPYCKIKVQQIIKQSNKKRIYNLNNLFALLESNRCHQFCNGPGIYWL
jgi:hypothetical protein